MKDIVTGALAILKRRSIGVLEYARTVEIPDGDFAGTKYDPSRHQAQEAILDAVESGAGWVAILKPVQDGGSLASFIPILRRAHALGQTAIIAYPTMDSAKDAWTKKVWPILEAQGGTTPKKGGGSRGGAARVVTLPSGGSIILRAAGGRKESGQASVTADAMLVDEVDDWEDLRVLRLIERRLSRSRDPLIVYISTCKRDAQEGVDRSRIVRLWEAGTRSRLHYRCPMCSASYPLEWEMVDVETATMQCPACAARLTDSDRVEMLKTWKRVDGQDTHKFSIMWTALESPFPMLIDGRKLPVLRALCDEYKTAKESADTGGDHGLIRQFYRDRLCRPYLGDQQIDEDAKETPHTHRTLAVRSESTAWATVQENADENRLFSRYFAEPHESIKYCSAAIDVQRNRLYWCLIGFDDDRRTYDLGWGIERARAGLDGKEPQPWSGLELSETMTRCAEWIEDIAGELFRVGVCDVGDGQTCDELARWLARRRTWHAIQGEDHLPAERKDGTLRHRSSMLAWDSRWRIGLGSFRVHTDLAQQHVCACYKIARDKPGAGLLPGPLRAGNTYLRHLTAVGNVKMPSGSTVWRQLPGAGRFDYLDCRAYATAVGLVYHGKHVQQNQQRQRPVGKVGSFI